MNLSLDIKIQAKDLYRFNMYQTYHGFHGWMSVILSLLAFAMAYVTLGKTELLYTIIYVVGGFLLLFYIPLSLWTRANATMKTNQVLAGTLHYEFTPEAIRVTQGEESGELPWESVYKVVSTKDQVLIYSNRINAYIIPRTQLQGADYETFCRLAKEELEGYRIRLGK